MAIEVYSVLGIEATTSLSWSLGQGIASVTDTSIPRIPRGMPTFVTFVKPPIASFWLVLVSTSEALFPIH